MIARYVGRRIDALGGVAEEACRLVSLQLWWVAIACMRDFSGLEIERHLGACRDEFRDAVIGIALQQDRTWASWRARRLATLCIFLAYLCQRSRYHGSVVWMIRGIPKGVLVWATALRAKIGGKEAVHTPSLNSTGSDLKELCDGGLLIREQFAWQKVPAWCRGRAKKVDGEHQQWAFSHYFLTICPFRSGTEGRLVPAPRGTPIKRRRQMPRPQSERDADALAAQRQAAAQRAAEANAAELAAGLADLGELASVRTRAERREASRAAHTGALQRRMGERTSRAAQPETTLLAQLVARLSDTQRELLAGVGDQRLQLQLARGWLSAADAPEPTARGPT